MRMQRMDVSDLVVKAAVAVTESQVQNAQNLLGLVTSAVQNWQTRVERIQYTAKSPLVPKAQLRHDTGRLHLVADSWCCAVQPTSFIANEPVACAGYMERMVRRTLYESEIIAATPNTL